MGRQRRADDRDRDCRDISGCAATMEPATVRLLSFGRCQDDEGVMVQIQRAVVLRLTALSVMDNVLQCRGPGSMGTRKDASG
jgi:hypothetical protein